jgi:hypothetical protein
VIADQPRARVTLERRRLWRVRASLVLMRWLLYAVVLAGMAAAVRGAIAMAPAAAGHAGLATHAGPVSRGAHLDVRPEGVDGAP